ncbi:multiple sugar transport system substrate-binding protein [Hephaestia caeni]|uniref:Multiple sugar transport system substrate-binding protein n=1 Tax=Hephaestia caeni TaxID=645617 RepID=A0A397P9E2_9SPHN|nr:extracellular solute-binding protein [Hephaestia caeni]RIA43785.1 multiple sugar transport system substrate-binding protein [Hephaestia caeni]
MTETLRIAVRKFDPFESAIQKQFADFVATTGTDARLEAVAMDLNPLHEAAIEKRGLATGGWDIAFMATDWLAEAQAGGLLEDLTPHMARAPVADFPDAWSPSLTTMQRFAGGFWGMPYHDGPECLIYRKDLLDAAGIAVPATWDDFHAAARALHAPDRDQYGTVLALFPDGHNSFYDFCIHIWSRGGEPFTADGRPAFTSPQAHDALDFLRMLAADTEAMAPGARDLDSVKSGLLFAEGKVALMANWFGFAAYADTAPDSRVKGLVDVAPLPAGPGGRSVSLNVFWVLTIGSGSPRKQLAWDFLRHCATAPMDKLTTTEGAIGVRKSTWTDPEINADVPYYHRLDWLHEHAREMPLTPKLAEISHIVDDMLTAAVTGDAPTADLLAEAQARAEALA